MKLKNKENEQITFNEIYHSKRKRNAGFVEHVECRNSDIMRVLNIIYHVAKVIREVLLQET